MNWLRVVTDVRKYAPGGGQWLVTCACGHTFRLVRPGRPKVGKKTHCYLCWNTDNPR